MQHARDLMRTPVTVAPDLGAKELYTFLHDRDLDGACVVDDDGGLVGVVTTMDLIFREKNVHLPTFFFFLDAMIPTGDPRHTYEEVRKIAGSRAGDLATRDLVTVQPDATLAEVASAMVEHHVTILPVVRDEGELVGMITKDDVLRATYTG